MLKVGRFSFRQSRTNGIKQKKISYIYFNSYAHTEMYLLKNHNLNKMDFNKIKFLGV